MKHRYNRTGYLDKKLKKLEQMADKIGFDIDTDTFYRECCTIITDAELEHNTSDMTYMESTNFWMFYNLAVANMENMGRI